MIDFNLFLYEKKIQPWADSFHDWNYIKNQLQHITTATRVNLKGKNKICFILFKNGFIFCKRDSNEKHIIEKWSNLQNRYNLKSFF
jgi:hypothetical protein